MKPSRWLYLADVVVQRELKLEACSGPDLWAAGVADALPEAELLELTASMGRRFGRITECFDHFHRISAEVKVARDLHVQAVNFFTGKVAGH